MSFETSCWSAYLPSRPKGRPKRGVWALGGYSMAGPAPLSQRGPRGGRYKKLEDLLEKSFSLVRMPSLQPVVMCVMKHLPKVPK